MLAIGEKYRNFLEAGLRKYTDDAILWLPENPDVDPRLSGHADLGIFAGKGGIVAAKGLHSRIVKELTNVDREVICSEEQSREYPGDAGLCICRTGRWTIYNPKTVDRQTRAFLDDDRIAVNQGYTRCSVCVVSDEAIITSDRAISSRASECGLDVLEIRPGHILLEGFDYGFIGGSTFLLSRNVMAFTGTLDNHPDKDRILCFLHKHGVEAVFLTESPIFDIGGVVALP